MMKKLVLLLVLGLFTLSHTGCTSGDSAEDEEASVEQADSEESGDASEDVEKATEEVASQDSQATDQAQTSETLPEDAIGEPLDSTKSSDSGVTLLDEKPAETPTEQQSQTITNTTPEPPVETPAPTSTDSSSQNVTELTPAPATTEEKPKPVPASLQKVAMKPWKVGKTWFNAVYFARPGDTIKSISQNIYGANKVSLLKKGNPFLNNRSVKPGDKVYYNSPKRPEDSENMQTYYEENGLAPEVYVSKAGDDIKKISKDLLGFDNAWKEIWASNLSVESKGSLPEGTELRYWKTVPMPAATATVTETPAAQPPIDQNLTPPPAQAEQMQPPPGLDQQMPAPGQDVAAQIPPVPTPDIPAPSIPEAQPMAPPEPARIEEIPAPQPAVVENKPAVAHEEKAAEDDIMALLTNEDNIMILGAAAIAIAGAAALLVIRKKKKQREIEEALSNTQVG